MVHELVPGSGMPATGLHKQAKPHPWNAGSMKNHAPFSLQKNLFPWNSSLVPKRLGATGLDEET